MCHAIPEGEQRYRSAISVTSALLGVDGCHVQAALLPGKRPGNNCTGGWMDARDGVDGIEKSRTYRDSISGPYNAIPAHTTEAAETFNQ
jgi:hypothetical protein